MKIEQQARSGAAAQDVYTGEEGQITADTDNWDLRLHDGVTPGGKKIINRDNGDERWQGKSVELDGFSFSASARGYVTRLAAGNYKIRTLTVNGDQMTITNANGYAGNPYITLNERIETDHIFGGDILIEGVLQVNGGVTADTAGTHTGPVVGNVTGNVTGNTTGTHTGPTNGLHTGAVDVRGETLQLDDNQIGVSKINGLAAFILATAVPSGIISMWSGSSASIPDGWYLCNGLNGTPDLTDKFIIGAGGVNYDPGDEGGAATHSHVNTMDAAGVHTHTVTVDDHALTEAEMPAHKHGNGVCDNIPDLYNHSTLTASPATSAAIESNGATGDVEGYTTTVGSGDGHNHTASTGSAGSHTHVLNNASASSLPPYYALCFIMRVIV